MSYRVIKSICIKCSIYTPFPIKHSSDGSKAVIRNTNQDLFEKEISRMQEELFKKRLKEKM